MMMIIILATIGLCISFYGILVERKLQQDSQYKAACDISDTISCTRPMLSEYNKILGISNSLAATGYYLVIIMLALLDQKQFLLFIIPAGLLVSAVFAYILYFKIRSFCLICTSLYCINIGLACALYPLG